jgi:hypothetical protein
MNTQNLDPPPDELDASTGQGLWIIKDYKIWANTYKEALMILELIENN